MAVGCTIREDLLGKYEVKFMQIESQVPSFKNGFKKAKVTDLHSFSEDTLTGAVENADAYIFNNYKKSTGLIDQKAGWRSDGPSEKQVKLLKKFGYPNAGELSKGEACNLLSKHFAAQGDKKPAYKKYSKK